MYMLFSSSILLVVIIFLCVFQCYTDCVTEIECLNLLVQRDSHAVVNSPLDFVNSIVLCVILIVFVIYVVLKLRQWRKVNYSLVTGDCECNSDRGCENFSNQTPLCA